MPIWLRSFHISLINGTHKKQNEELEKAVDLWCINKNKTLKKYGHISIWDTSLITDMSYLFDEKECNQIIKLGKSKLERAGISKKNLINKSI